MTQDLSKGKTETDKAANPIFAEYLASESPLPYTEWLEAKLEELVPNCMKTWKED